MTGTKTMETKNATIRIPLELAGYLSKKGSINQGIIDGIEALKTIRMYSETELKGRFTSKEWIFFADSLNGTMTEGLFRCNASALVAHCEDSETYEGTASKTGVELKGLIEKVSGLTGAQVEALYNRVEEWWENPIELEKWAKF